MTLEIYIGSDRLPPLVEISETLIEREWKIEYNDTTQIRAKKINKPPEYTVGDGVTWYVIFNRPGPGGKITVSIPAMIESGYARKRVLDTVAEILDATNHEYVTDESLEYDVLADLREGIGDQR
jgi:hypothetical protein